MAHKINSFDRDTMRTLRKEIDNVLSEVAQHFGISITTGAGRYGDKNAYFKIELAVVSSTGAAETKERTAFKTLAQLYGLQASDLDREFTSHGITYKIDGLNTKAKRYPIVAKRVSDGARFKMNATAVKAALAASK